jgi:hypothetical protein
MAKHNGKWNGKDAYHFSSKDDAEAGQEALSSLLGSFE